MLSCDSQVSIQALSLHTHPSSQAKETSVPSWRLGGATTRPLSSWSGRASHDFARRKGTRLAREEPGNRCVPFRGKSALGTCTVRGCRAPGSRGRAPQRVSSAESVARLTAVGHFLSHWKEFLVHLVIITMVNTWRWQTP